MHPKVGDYFVELHIVLAHSGVDEGVLLFEEVLELANLFSQSLILLKAGKEVGKSEAVELGGSAH